MKHHLALAASLLLGFCSTSRADTTYLGLKQAQNVKTGWNNPGDNKTINGHELSVGTTFFERGFTLHAPGEATFALDGNRRWLTFYTGIAGDMTENSSATLTVELDGKPVYTSPVLRFKEEPIYLALPLDGAKTVRFVIGDGGNGTSADHVVVALPRTTTDMEKPTPDLSVLAPIVPVSVSEIAALMPKHGTVSTMPAKSWEDGLAAGNGSMGALLYGNPRRDTLLIDHAKLWLPAGSREVLPEDGGETLREMRRLIAAQGYDAGQKYFIQKAKEGGWGGSLVWTDAFHPGFFLKIEQPQDGAISNYARIEDFATGEVHAQWKTVDGDFARRMFVSKTDNTVVSTTTGPRGKVSLKIMMQPVDNNLIDSRITHENGWIVCHNVYVKGKGGYDGAVRVVHDGGTQTSDGNSVSVVGANSVTLLVRILPYRTPLTDGSSQAWPNDPKNPDFLGAPRVAKRDTVQITGTAYDPKWMTQLRADLGSMPTEYNALLKPHAAKWGALFNRVSIDLGGSAKERGMSSEALLDLAQKEKRMPPALLERMYDAGRYVFMCSAGPESPPNLFGIWTGTWSPAWSGDYTTDTNLQLDTELAYSANLPELMDGYFRLWNSYIPDFRRNAKGLYGARGIVTGSRASNNGLALHWDGGWVGNQWTPGAAWIAHWYFDHYQYTGDQKFLREQAIPWMKECALFYEDFLQGTEDANGKFRFSPSFSAENGSGDNTAQDIQIVHELLTNLIAGCETLGVERENVAKWRTMLRKLPPLLINEQGQLKEWANSTNGERNDHRHLMHLYGAFESVEFSEETDPKIFAAAKVALWNRVNASQEDATHGYMHTGLAAVGLGMGDLAYARIEEMAKRRSMYSNMVAAHFGGPRVLCDDGNGATPEIVNRMFVQSKMGRLTLLPAVPSQLPKGSLNGTLARGAISVERLSWDMNAGTCETVLNSKSAQTLDLAFGRDLKLSSLLVNGKAVNVVSMGVEKWGAKVALPAGKSVRVAVKFARLAPAPIVPVKVAN